jgi:hypothetical protein
MEVSTSSVLGSARIALQVISNYKRPVLEIYWEVRNRIRTTVEESSGIGVIAQLSKGTHSSSHQDTFIEFSLVNIGSVRAEDINFVLISDFKHHLGKLSDIRLFRDAHLHQFTPAQRMHLFSIDFIDLIADRKSGEFKAPFTIRIAYNGPDNWSNKLGLWWARIRHTHQYEMVFTFDPQCMDGLDYPPPEYV